MEFLPRDPLPNTSYSVAREDRPVRHCIVLLSRSPNLILCIMKTSEFSLRRFKNVHVSC